jgi:hypothetical protein
MSESLNLDKGQVMPENLKAVDYKVRTSAVGKDAKLIISCFQEASKKLSPLWDARDYVAVNPFFGYRDQNFLEAAKFIKYFSENGILPKKDYFLKKYSSGEVTDHDLETAIKIYQKEQKISDSEKIDLHKVLKFIESDVEIQDSLKVHCISDLYDLRQKTDMTEKITFEISKWLAAYFDEGQAVWGISKKDLRLYSWWKSLAKYDKPFGTKNNKFTELVDSLPNDPSLALQALTEKLIDQVSLTPKDLSNYYYCLINTVMGWSSYLQKFEFEATRSGDGTKLKQIGGLIDIVTLRIAYDILFLEENLDLESLKIKSIPETDPQNIDYSYICLTALEIAYRRNIEKAIMSKPSEINEESAPDIQAAFCIDVRSEILRRHLENLSPKIETIGFAGFFAMPISLKGLGNHESDQNCPVLLNSNFDIHETAGAIENVLKNKKSSFVENLYLKKMIQSSANSGFSFMETVGISYINKIISTSFGKTPNIQMSSLGLSAQDKKGIHLDLKQLSLEQKVNLGFGALKNMGLTQKFAKYVFFFGHGGESANNPYASALDCGACAGHNGQGNANLLAGLLNEQEVRVQLKQKGINIPEATIFLSGWHNTTKDELIVDEFMQLTANQKDDLKDFNKIFNTALENCRQERANKLPRCSNLENSKLKIELNLRANDWSEIRPEWGLARNASFIVGRRKLTRSLNLEGRSFLHDYDSSKDDDLSILELIMTAPMIVTNWINMQYYASTVDPKKFGAGNKVLNNVVGGIGCIQGNESDLLGGLTEQSVWYKGDYYHEPIRLQVFIEAEFASIDKIIDKHQLVKDLVSNNWLHIISIDPSSKKFNLYQDGTWITTKENLWN